MRKPYKLADIIQIANRAYADGLVGRAFKGEDVGDTLAVFIARELKDTFDPKASAIDQIKEAGRVISHAYVEIGDVARAFSDVLGDLIVKGKVIAVPDEGFSTGQKALNSLRRRLRNEWKARRQLGRA